MNEKYEILDSDKNQNIDDFYHGFREKLEQAHSFPTDYIFKYIVPAEQSVIAQLHAIFQNANASISSRDSKTGKYTSFTIKIAVNDADDIIIYYRQAATIKGIVAL